MRRIDDFVLEHIKPNVWNFIKFSIVFSTLYYVFIKTLPYTGPFVIGLIVALLSIAPIKWLVAKFKIKESYAVIIVNSLVFIIVFIFAALFLVYVGYELKHLFSSIYDFIQNNYKDIVIDIQKRIEEFINVDDAFLKTITEALLDGGKNISSTVMSQSSSIIDGVVKFIAFIPNVLIILLFSVFSAFPISNELLKTNLITKINKPTKTEMMIRESIDSVGKYVITFGLLVFITFITTLIGFLIFKIPYALVLSILCAILDLLPIVGTVMVFIPLIIVYLIEGNYFLAFALLGLYLLIQVVRQSIQPKLLSSTLDIHPIATLFAIFAGLKLAGFVGMIYFIGLFVGYGIFKRVVIDNIELSNEIEL